MGSEHTKTRRAAAALLLMAGALLVGTNAAADPTPADRETARALMNQGDKKFASGDFAGAMKAYEGADTIMKVPSTGAALARAQASMGLLVEARDTAVSVVRTPLAPGAPKAFVKAHADAEHLAQELEGRIPSLQISVDGPGPGVDTTVTLDGGPVPAALLTLPRKVDPGKHVVHASAPGYADASSDVTVQEGQTDSVKLTLTPLPKGAASASTAPAGPASGTFGSEPPPEAPHRLSPLVYAGFGVGGVGLAVGAVTGIMHLSKVSSIKSDYCNGGTACRPGFEDQVSSSKTLATVSDIAFVVGAVGVGIGVYGLVAPHGASAASSGAARTPAGPWCTASVGLGSLELDGAF